MTNALPLTVPMLVIDVEGEPIPQGSKSARVAKGRAIMYEANKRLPAWRASVIAAAEARARVTSWTTLAAPIDVQIDFYLPRPKSVTPTRRLWPCVKPDVDKLARACLDALTISRVIVDDACVVHLDVWKRYSTTGTIGARIVVSPIA